MRTKSFVAAAALIAAGALSSQAQSNVYSLNVVGYVNITIKPGYNLLTAQLKDTASPTAQISVILTNITGLADGSTFISWNPTTQDFNQAANWVQTPPDGPAWYNGDYTAFADNTAARGTSFFIKNEGGTDATLTLVGEVPQGADTTTVPNNYGFLADFAPVSQEIITNGFPIDDDSTVQTYSTTLHDYTQALNGIKTPPDGPAWYNGDFTATVPFAPLVGQGFVYHTVHGSQTWNRNFTVK